MVDIELETFNVVYGCQFGCPYCYAREKFSSKDFFQNGFDRPVYNLKAFDNLKRRPEIYVGSIMGDICTPAISDDVLREIFRRCSVEFPQHLFFLLTKNPQRYFTFFDKYEILPPKNVYFGTSIENERYGYRLEHLKRLKRLDPETHLWVENEPLFGLHRDIDYTDVEYQSVSAIGLDQTYRSTADGHVLRKCELWNDDWIESLYRNPTVNHSRLSIYKNIKELTRLEHIKRFQNFNLYDLLKRPETESFDSLF